MMQKQKQNPSDVNPEDSEGEGNSQQILGVEAIFSHKYFTTKSSSIYVETVHSFFDQQLPINIISQRNIQDPNLFYSLNISSLWILLKNRLKKLSAFPIFQSNSDKSVIKFSLIIGSILALNDAKQKLIDEKRKQLRKYLKNQINDKRRLEAKRCQSISSQFNKSNFFNDFIAEKLNINDQKLKQLQQKLLNIDLNEPEIVRYLKKTVSYIQKSVQRNSSQIKKKTQSKISETNLEIREAYNIILLCYYLNIHLSITDWVNNILKVKPERINSLFFCNIIRQNGCHILKRILDDAPLTAINKEIENLGNFYKS